MDEKQRRDKMRRKRFWIVGLVLALVLAGVVPRPTYAATVTVNSTTDVNDGDTSSIANLIADPGTDGVISLREAIQAANNTSGLDTIEFNIPLCGGPCTIQPASALPVLNAGGTTIDGYSQAGAVPGALRIEIDGSGAGYAYGFLINSAGNVIQGLVINRFSRSGICLEGGGATNNTIAGNFIGLAADGTTDLGNTQDGVYIYAGAQNNTIGGDTDEERNIISGNQIFGIFISGSGTMNNIVSGNYIGTDVSGTVDRGNDWSGIFITGGAQNNTIGGDTDGERNVISGNNEDGVRIQGSSTMSNTISGNYIGIYDYGTGDLGNTYNGVSISDGAQNNTIGGNTDGERNVIASNDQNGVYISESGTMNNIVSGNYIGLDAFANDQGNGENGVYIYNGAQNNTIGGDMAGERNLISGNSQSGVRLEGSGTTGNIVSGNYIGLAADGTTERGNSYNGVFIGWGPQNNTIGGNTAGTGNVISGNYRRGVYIYGSDTMSNTVSGNIIGLAADGTTNRGNGYSGVFISGNAQNNTIGGDAADERNVISGNDRDGVRISGSFTTGNIVSGNYIGLTVGGTFIAGNDQNGVYLYGSTKNNTIGGDTPGERNVISGNLGDGIHLDGNGTTNNTVSGNYIGPYADGTSSLGGNRGNGVHIGLNPHTNTIGGDTAGERNVISGNGGSGVYILGDGNTVSGNYIGTDYDGTDSLGNVEHGVYITNGGQNNTIGGDASGERNVISGNDDSGVYISGSGTTNNTVSGNYIGINADSTSELPNRDHGIYIIDSAQNNTIGGDTAGERNVISGNLKDGVRIEGSGTMSNTVSGNTIGLAADGTTGLGNDNDGVYITGGAQNNTIGGDTAGEGNVISGNDFFGVRIEGSGTTGNTVSGNYIGTDESGTDDLGNTLDGVFIVGGAQNNTVGGDTDGERNVISGNDMYGVRIEDSGTTGNTISGNYIGTDESGTDERGNVSNGVSIDGAQNNTVGGATDGERNVISGNGGFGVFIFGSDATGNTVSGNYIGTDESGTDNLGNTLDGVFIVGGAQNNTVGPGNVIAYSGYEGVEVNSGSTTGNTITQNSIFANDLMGIDLTAGANGDIAAPVIMTTTEGSVNVVGTACAGCTVEVFENSDADGEGETYVGDTTATTGGAFTVTVSSLSDPYLTATATDATDGTSEFSEVFTATVTGGGSIYLPIILKSY
jgi:hypothetical protein